jgi:hypothetical protein
MMRSLHRTLEAGTNATMAAVMLLVGVVNIGWAERLTVQEGLGWDGVYYARFVRDFQDILSSGVPSYYAQRVFPSGVVHYAMRLFSQPFTNANIVRAFETYNLVLLVLAAWVWGKIGDELAISNRAKWFGFVFLFASYAILKNNFYNAVLTDTTAFTIGMLLLYFFLRGSSAGLLIVLVISAFTWPTAPFLAALLFVFPYRKALASRGSDIGPTDKRYGTIAATLIAVITLGILIFLATSSQYPRWLTNFELVLRIDRPLIYLSIACVVAFLFIATRELLADESLYDVRKLSSAVDWRRLAIVIVVFVGLMLAHKSISTAEEIGWGSMKVFIFHTFMVSISDPFLFLVAHVVYFGPVIVLLALFWKCFCIALKTYGPGMQGVVLISVLLGINSQSRYEIAAVPIFVGLLVKVLDEPVLQRQNILVWLTLCLAYSKVWYRFNTGPQVFDGTMGSLQRFPLQHYFMNSGPWMSRPMYLVHAVAVIITGLLAYFLVFKGSERQESVPSPRIDSNFSLGDLEHR